MKKFLCTILLIISLFCFSGCFGNPELKEFTGVSFSDLTVTYDGEEKSITVIGAPQDATITYEIKNSQNIIVLNAVDVGVYTFTAVISKTGYNDKVLTAVLTIEEDIVPSGKNPDLSYFEISTEMYLYDVKGLVSVDMFNLVLDKTKTEIDEYYKTTWVLKSIGSKNPSNITFSSNIIDVSLIKKEQCTVKCLAYTSETESRELFSGLVDFYDSDDGVVWNTFDQESVDYIVSYHVVKEGVTFIEEADYSNVLEGGSCYVLKDDVFNMSDDEFETEVENYKQKLLGDTTLPQTNVSYLDGRMMLRPLHSKEYYLRFTDSTAYLSFDYYLYCEEAMDNEGAIRNCRDFVDFDHNIDRKLNTWYTVNIPFEMLLEYYDSYIGATGSISTGNHTALFSFMHNQLSASKPENVVVYKVEVIMLEFEVI